MQNQLKATQPAELTPEVQETLHTISLRVKQRLEKTMEDIIEIGKDLNKAKALVEHGAFLGWLRSEFDMSHTTAHRFMRVAELFGDKYFTVKHLSRRTLYELVAPSTTDELRAEVLQKLQAGEAITFEQLKAMKEDAEEDDEDGAKPIRSTILVLNRQVNHWVQQVSTGLQSHTGELDDKSRARLTEAQQQVSELNTLLESLLASTTVTVEAQEVAQKKKGRKAVTTPSKVKTATPKSGKKPSRKKQSK